MEGIQASCLGRNCRLIVLEGNKVYIRWFGSSCHILHHQLVHSRSHNDLIHAIRNNEEEESYMFFIEDEETRKCWYRVSFNVCIII
jgi:hypothetical protein